MARSVMRLNLTSVGFPLIMSNAGRQVIIPNADQTNIPQNTSERAMPFAMPQLIYAENILPTTHGYASIKYTESATPTIRDELFSRKHSLYQLRDEYDNRVFYFSDPTKNPTFSSRDTAWQETPLAADPSKEVTVAYLKEATYVLIPGLGIYTFDTASITFKQLTVKGLNATLLKGIVAANNFLIGYDDDTLYYSSSIDPLDFTPDIATGAGSTKVLAIKANILVCLPNADGFIIYTNKNAVAAMFSGNIQVPFVFREIPNASGISSISHVTYEAPSNSHIVWTASGLQEVTKSGATLIFPEVTEFLNSRMYEQFIKEGEFGQQYLVSKTSYTADTVVKLNRIGARYLCISFGAPDVDYFIGCLIYDESIGRWGRLMFKHVDMYEFVAPNVFELSRYVDYPVPYNDPSIDGKTYGSFAATTSAFVSPRKQLGALTPDGRQVCIEPISAENFGPEVGVTYLSGVAIFGHYQMTRTGFLLMSRVEVSGMAQPAPATSVLSDLVTTANEGVYLKTEVVATTSSSYSFSVPISSAVMKDPNTQEGFFTFASGRFHDVLVLGRFDLSNMEAQISTEGSM